MDNSMVAHLWANEKKEYAYGSNFYFEGDSLYSYGNHFKIGRIVRNEQGQRAYLVNLDKYSTSTAKHQNYMTRAIPDGEYIFDVGAKSIDRKPGVWFVVQKLDNVVDHIHKYKKGYDVGDRIIENVVKEVIDYIYFFDMGKPTNILKGSPDDILGIKHDLSWKSHEVKIEYIDKLKKLWDILIGPYSTKDVVDTVLGEGVYDKYLERNKKYKRRQEEKEALWKLNTEELIKKWKQGEVKNSINSMYTCLRVRKNKIETSKGITLDLEEASRIYKIIKARANSSREIKDADGHKWEINLITDEFLVAGCHKIKMTEVEEVAKELGLV